MNALAFFLGNKVLWQLFSLSSNHIGNKLGLGFENDSSPESPPLIPLLNRMYDRQGERFRTFASFKATVS